MGLLWALSVQYNIDPFGRYRTDDKVDDNAKPKDIHPSDQFPEMQSTSNPDVDWPGPVRIIKRRV